MSAVIFRRPLAREKAWGLFYGRRGLRLADEMPQDNAERVASWLQKALRLGIAHVGQRTGGFMNTPRFPVQDEPEDDYAEARRYAEEQMADVEGYDPQEAAEYEG